ncbi:MAG TPA: dienelactone hydrolase family protein [Ilumatobacteraceae bacterium]|nr:dienelactone hydrolase family protein [Ilumatobacteraceae bacterium]
MVTTRTDVVSLPSPDQPDAGMNLYLWVPDGGATAAILLIQEIFGVGDYITAVAERLAAAGYLVGAPDVFWRFAPGFRVVHDEDGLNQAFAAVGQLDPPLAIGDCTAALAHLAALDGIERTGVIGFCLGGTLAWGVAAAGDPDVCVSYYGSGVPDMIGMIDQVHCPTLFHFGNDDPYIANERVETINAAIAGREGFVLNVEHAGHAFDNHAAPMFHNESAAKAAWAKTMAFLQMYLGPA